MLTLALLGSGWISVSWAGGDSSGAVSAPLQDEAEDNSGVAAEKFVDSAGQAYYAEGVHGAPKLLYIANELSLMAGPTEGHELSYRFIYYPAFHAPLLVRLDRKDGLYTGRAVRFKRKEGEKLNTIFSVEQDTPLSLDADASKALDALLESKNFWTPLTADEEGLQVGLDGSIWVFERRDQNSQAVLNLWSPQKYSREELKTAGFNPDKLRDFLVYRKAGLTLLKQAGLVTSEKEIY